MISARALFDVAKRPVPVGERTGRHPRDASAPPTAAGVRLLRSTSRARVAFPWPAALRLFRRRRNVRPASTSTPADLRSRIRGPLRRLYIYALLNYGGNEGTLRVRHGSDGQPVVLLHGHPRAHTTWYWVAPQLDGSFFVVCPDLRGYGQSTPPPDAPGHAQSSKRAWTSCPLVAAACG